MPKSDPGRELASLPPVQKAEISRNLNEAQDWLKAARAKFDAALDAAYGEQARVALRESGRDFGTTHVSDGPLRISFELPRRVSWNPAASVRDGRTHHGCRRVRR